jgi:hypothetical protein
MALVKYEINKENAIVVRGDEDLEKVMDIMD